MRIGVFSPYLPTLSGGEKYMLTLATCLAASHDVDIFWNPHEEKAIKQKAKEKLAIDLAPVSFVDNIFTSSTPLLSRLVLSRSYDRIIFLSDGSIPTVLCPLIIHFQSPVEWVKVSFKTRVKLLVTKNVICNSLFTKSFIDKKFGIHTKVMYPPVTLSQRSDFKKEKMILNVGRLGVRAAGSSYKKQDMLAGIFKKMVDEGLRGWEMIFVVSIMDEDRDALTDLEKEVKNYPIKLVVNPSNVLLREYYEKAAVYWHGAGYGEDLINHPDRAEHFGISTVEAMSTGAVPIVIKAGGQIEIVDDGVNGYLWTSENELISRTKEVIDNEQHRKMLGEKAKRKSQQFGVDRFCKEVVACVS